MLASLFPRATLGPTLLRVTPRTVNFLGYVAVARGCTWKWKVSRHPKGITLDYCYCIFTQAAWKPVMRLMATHFKQHLHYKPRCALLKLIKVQKLKNPWFLALNNFLKSMKSYCSLFCITIHFQTLLNTIKHYQTLSNTIKHYKTL